MGRKKTPKDEIRDKLLSVRLTHAEYDEFHKLCHLEFRSMASIAYKAIIFELKRMRGKY